MTKTEMTKLVRSMGANENTVSAMENAYEMGVEFERARCERILREWINSLSSEPEMEGILKDIQNGATYP
jgi:hypothetical protein